MLFRELAERLRINPDEFVGLIEVRAAARRERGANFAHGIVDLVCNIRILDLAARNPSQLPERRLPRDSYHAYPACADSPLWAVKV